MFDRTSSAGLCNEGIIRWTLTGCQFQTRKSADGLYSWYWGTPFLIHILPVHTCMKFERKCSRWRTQFSFYCLLNLFSVSLSCSLGAKYITHDRTKMIQSIGFYSVQSALLTQFLAYLLMQTSAWLCANYFLQLSYKNINNKTLHPSTKHNFSPPFFHSCFHFLLQHEFISKYVPKFTFKINSFK
jgi:hypothetical protein